MNTRFQFINDCLIENQSLWRFEPFQSSIHPALPWQEEYPELCQWLSSLSTLQIERLKASNRELDEEKAELLMANAQLEEQNRKLLADKEAAEKKQKQAEAETLAMNERASGQHDKQARRAKMIAQAMLMAQVKEVAKVDGKIQFVVLDVKQSNVRMGSRLAIRRNTGIVGEVEITRMDAEATVADPLPNAVGKIDIKQGDELIIPIH